MKKINFIGLLLLIMMSFAILCSCGGEQCPQGEQGIQGEKGEDGTSLLTGNDEPADTIGIVGDSYIDLESWNFYIKSTDGWILKGNIKGESGKDDSADHNGTEGLVFYPISDTECAVGIGNAIYYENSVYWAGQWEYDENGDPTPIINNNEILN